MKVSRLLISQFMVDQNSKILEMGSKGATLEQQSSHPEMSTY